MNGKKWRAGWFDKRQKWLSKLLVRGWIASFSAQFVPFSHYIRYKRIIVSASHNWESIRWQSELSFGTLRLKRYNDFWVLIRLENSTYFWTIFCFWEIEKLVPGINFYGKFLLWLLLWPQAHCIELIQYYYWMIHFLADHKSHHHSPDGALQITVDFNKAERWRILLSLQITPILLLALCVFSLIDVWMSALLENISLNVFHLIFADCRFKLKFKIKYQRCLIYFIFRETFPSWACLDWSGFKDIFQ